MILDNTTRKLQVVLGEAHTTNALAVVTSWFDSGISPSGGPQLANTNGTTAVDIVNAPASGYIRQVNELTVFNADTVTHAVTVRYNDNGTTYTVIKVSLLTGETITYSKSLGWHTLDASGNMKQSLSGTTANLTDVAVGTFTPTDGSGAGLTFASASGNYVKIGRLVFVSFSVQYPATANGSNNKIGSLPYPITGSAVSVREGNSTFTLLRYDDTNTFCQVAVGDGTPVTNATLSTTFVVTSGCYKS